MNVYIENFYNIVEARNGSKTLVLHTSGGIQKTIHSLYDPAEEARTLVDAFEFDKRSILVVLGMGLGYHLSELVRRFEGVDIFVVESSTEIYNHAKKHLPALFSKFNFIVGASHDDVMNAISRYQVQCGLRPISVFKLSSTVSAFPEYYNPLLKRLDALIKRHREVYVNEKLGQKDELYDMKSYWDACARDNARRHIACDNWENEEDFDGSGERDIEVILNNIHHDCLDKDNSRVLEIGCGVGRLLKPFAKRYPSHELYGVDVSEEMVIKGNQRLKDYERVRLYRNNGKDLEMFSDNYFQFIYSYIVFQHIPRKFVNDYFKEVARVLDEECFFVFQLPISPADTEIPEPPDTDFRTVRHYAVEEAIMMCTSNRLTVEKISPISGNDEYSDSAWFTVVKRAHSGA